MDLVTRRVSTKDESQFKNGFRSLLICFSLSLSKLVNVTNFINIRNDIGFRRPD